MLAGGIERTGALTPVMQSTLGERGWYRLPLIRTLVLVVSGQMDSLGLREIGFFEIGRLGLPIALVGLVAVIVLAPRVLPDCRSARAEMEEGVGSASR